MFNTSCGPNHFITKRNKTELFIVVLPGPKNRLDACLWAILYEYMRPSIGTKPSCLRCLGPWAEFISFSLLGVHTRSARHRNVLPENGKINETRFHQKMIQPKRAKRTKEAAITRANHCSREPHSGLANGYSNRTGCPSHTRKASFLIAHAVTLSDSWGWPLFCGCDHYVVLVRSTPGSSRKARQ